MPAILCFSTDCWYLPNLDVNSHTDPGSRLVSGVAVAIYQRICSLSEALRAPDTERKVATAGVVLIGVHTLLNDIMTCLIGRHACFAALIRLADVDLKQLVEFGECPELRPMISVECPTIEANT